MSKVTPFLMFNDQLEAAMEFYTATFPDSEIRNVARTGEDGPVTSAETAATGRPRQLNSSSVRPAAFSMPSTVTGRPRTTRTHSRGSSSTRTWSSNAVSIRPVWGCGVTANRRRAANDPLSRGRRRSLS